MYVPEQGMLGPCLQCMHTYTLALSPGPLRGRRKGSVHVHTVCACVNLSVKILYTNPYQVYKMLTSETVQYV